ITIWRCSQFTSQEAWSNLPVYPYSRAVWSSAWMSFPKQLPPQPTPGLRNFDPMRESKPIPVMTSVTSAPTRSQILAISLANPIFMARNALAAYLIISALVREVVNNGVAWMEEGRGRPGGGSKLRSEERRVGKEGRSRWSPYH